MLRSERAGSVAIWTVDRPAAKNALDRATMEALTRTVEEARADATLRAAILTGAGEAFVSGGDLRELRDKNTEEDAVALSEGGFALTEGIAALPFPVVCAIPGPALGGGAELAVACDLRIADARARIGFVQARMGVSTAWGTVPRLVALVGPGTAARLLYAAHVVDASEARAIGLVDAAVDAGRALDTAMQWAEEITKSAPGAVAAMKRLVRAASQHAAEAVRPLERAEFAATWSSVDHAEAVAAYFERRAPRWGVRG
ncbi:MAG: enoyl-CoA hydratase/isomerase family protein [Deltaproteobacteria bacterium]|nr:enoyl-CoA hydratase/isomerase family protein [Deltaproteobacteria bacterium]